MKNIYWKGAKWPTVVTVALGLSLIGNACADVICPLAYNQTIDYCQFC